MSKHKNKPKFILKKTYLARIKKSKGTKMFQDCFVKNKKIENITQKGIRSCALFVSSILCLFGLIQSVHATIKGTIQDMKKFGWIEISRPKQGSVLLWEEKNRYYHLGFYLGSQKAISNDPKKRTIQIHHFTFQGKRKIEKIFWHKKLN